MSNKTARGPIKLRNTGEGWVIEHGFDEVGPLMASQVADVVEGMIKKHPDAVVIGPTHTLGRNQTADPYSRATFAVMDHRGKVVDEGYSMPGLLNQNIGRLLGWRRGSEEGVPMTTEKQATSQAGRQRRTWAMKKKAEEVFEKEAARAPSGLYGFTKKTQKDCESAISKINRRARAMVRAAYKKDERVLSFLETHSKRASSNPARALLAAWKNVSKVVTIEGGKVAAGRSYSLYGYPSKTVKLGLALCSQLREETGTIAADLHARRVARHGKITAFFKEHSKKTRCYSSRMLLAGYPDPDARYATELNKTARVIVDACGEECDCGEMSASCEKGACGCGDGEKGACDQQEGVPQPTSPTTVDEWLSWDLDDLD